MTKKSIDDIVSKYEFNNGETFHFVEINELRKLLADSVRNCDSMIKFPCNGPVIARCKEEEMILGGKKIKHHCQACQRVFELMPSVKDEVEKDD